MADKRERVFARAVFRNHGYGHSTLGTSASISANACWAGAKVQNTLYWWTLRNSMVSGRGVRFCDPETGVDYEINAANAPFDMLKVALLHNKSVQVGVQNFGRDASGAEKLCIDRVVLSN